MEHGSIGKRLLEASLVFTGLGLALIWMSLEALSQDGLLLVQNEGWGLVLFTAIHAVHLMPTFLAVYKLPSVPARRERIGWALVAMALPAFMILHGLAFADASSKQPVGQLYLLIFVPSVAVVLAKLLLGRRTAESP